MSSNDSIAKGTLLTSSGEPILTADQERILVEVDELKGNTYGQGWARIKIDDPETEQNERGWVVVNGSGERVIANSGSPLVVSPEGYTIATESTGGGEGGNNAGDQTGEGGSGLPESTGTVGKERQYAIEEWDDDPANKQGPYFNNTSPNYPDATLTIGDVTLKGVYDVTQSGAGRKSQYLKETQVGGGDQPQSPASKYGIDPNASEDQNTEDGEESNNSEDASSGGGKQTPPSTVKAKAYVGPGTYEDLAAMRSRTRK